MRFFVAFLVFIGLIASTFSLEYGEIGVEGRCLSVMRELIETGHAPDYAGSSQKLEELSEEVESIRDEFKRRLRSTEGACYVGATSKTLPDCKVTASTQHSHCTLPNIYLHSPTSWCASSASAGSWVNIEFTTPRNITGVVTRGRQNYGQWVKTYKVEYGNSITSLQPILENGSTKVFTANIDQHAFVRNFFPEPVAVHHIRIYPLSWQGHPSMRMDLLDC